MKRLAIALLLACAAEQARGDDWTTGDTVRQAALSALILADWGQTQQIARGGLDQCKGAQTRCTYYFERGPAAHFIGTNPSVGQVNNYFAASLLLSAGVAAVLPRGWRDAFQYVYIGYEVRSVESNRGMGLTVRLPF